MARLNRNEAGAQANSGALAVTTTAQQVVGLRQQRVSMSLRNNGSTDIFLGQSAAVTTASGYPLRSGEEYEFTEYLGPVFAISASSADLRFFEVY